MASPSTRSWQTMTTRDVERFVVDDPVVVLPLASIEQHGPHLPLSTDLDIGLGLLDAALDRVEAATPVSTLPAIGVGSSVEHSRFAGTLSLDADLLSEVVYQHGLGLHRCGVRRLLLLNSHGGNVATVETAGLRLRADCGLLVVKSHYFLFPPPDGLDIPAAEWAHGLHGGTVETAMMLHLRPDLVRPDATEAIRSASVDLAQRLSEVGPADAAASFAWLAGDLSPSGVTGDAPRATAELGRRLVEYYAERLAGVIRDTAAFPLDGLG